MRLIKNLLRNGVQFMQRRQNSTLSSPQYHLGERNQSLLSRLAYYIDNKYNNNDDIKKNLRIHNSSKQIGVENNSFKQYTDEQLQNVLSNLKERKIFSKSPEFKYVINKIDYECMSRLDNLDPKSILNILNALAQIDVESIMKYKIYEFGLNNLIDNIDFLNQKELLQTMFYLSLKKKDKDVQKVLKNCMTALQKYDFNELGIEELCIICNSTFRTSTKISNKRILDKINKTINDNLYILHDPAIFVTLIKTLRHNRNQDNDILSTIACTILFNKTYKNYSFMAMCHILALFADYTYYDENLLRLLTISCLKEINRVSTNINAIRNKDITRFLWAMSVLNYCEDTGYIKIILPIIEQKALMGYYKNDIEDLVELMLYLWMLNYQPIDLIQHTLTPKTISLIKNQKSRTKIRLNLFLSCLYFENRQLFNDLNTTLEPFRPVHTKLHLERRPHFSWVYEMLLTLKSDLPKNLRFEITYEVPHLDICGITGYNKENKKEVYIEVLDETTCVRNRESWPNGPMFLKLRLLKSLPEALIVIDEEMATNSTEEELKDFLIQEIQLLC
nr:uncharacterized protein LOC111418809 [Onthophagus taurus]